MPEIDKGSWFCINALLAWRFMLFFTSCLAEDGSISLRQDTRERLGDERPLAGPSLQFGNDPLERKGQLPWERPPVDPARRRHWSQIPRMTDPN
jgi:hypothetical protein